MGEIISATGVRNITFTMLQKLLVNEWFCLICWIWYENLIKQQDIPKRLKEKVQWIFKAYISVYNISKAVAAFFCHE